LDYFALGLLIISTWPLALRTAHRFFYYRALAADLEDTVIDFERLGDSRAPALSRAVH
jgi:hypothetical protein